jgi:hypothetical protein
MATYPKPHTFRSQSWLRAVASLPCQICGIDGQSQAAHINMGKGMGIKTHDCWCSALCQTCHSRIDQGKDLTRAERREMLERATLMTLAELALRGLVKP